jgi:hypothetical protein
MELAAGNDDRIQLFGPGHRSFEFYRSHGASTVPLLEVDDRYRPDPRRNPQPRIGRKPQIWTAADRDYETLRSGMQTLFRHLDIETQPAAA